MRSALRVWGHSGASGQFSSSVCKHPVLLGLYGDGSGCGVLCPRHTGKGQKSLPLSSPALSPCLCPLKTPVDPAKDAACTSHSLHQAFPSCLCHAQPSGNPSASAITYQSDLTCRPAVDFPLAQTFILPHKTHAACAELPVGSAVTSTLRWKS